MQANLYEIFIWSTFIKNYYRLYEINFQFYREHFWLTCISLPGS